MSPTSVYGSWLALGLAAIVLLLLLWQWADRRFRSSDLSDADRAHFRGQDVRRAFVAGAMALLASGIFVGSRMPYKVNGRPNLAFLEIWLAILALILILIGLALVDWFATRAYARRHRSEIVREGMEIIQEELRIRSELNQGRTEINGRNGFPRNDKE